MNLTYQKEVHHQWTFTMDWDQIPKMLGSDPQSVGIRSQNMRFDLRFLFVHQGTERTGVIGPENPPLPTIVGRHKCTLPNSCKHSIYNSHNSVGVALVSFSGTKMVQVDSLSSFCPVVSVDRAPGLLGKYSGSAWINGGAWREGFVKNSM